MAQPTYIARKGEDADFAALTVDSLTVNTVSVTAGAITLADAELITMGTSSDVTLQWDATNLLMAAAADDSVFEIGDSGATQKSFDIKIYGQAANGADYLFWDASASALKFVGDARLDFTGNTILAANTDGGIIKGGAAGASAIVQDTADMKFVSFYFDDGATSGEARGIYDCLYVTGTGGSGTALRALCDVTNVVAVDARGAHISLSFGATGTVSGSGQALTLTLHVPDDATQTGTLSALTTEIYSEGDTSDPAGSVLSCWRASSMGGAGHDDVDTDCSLIHIDSGFTVGDGLMVAKKAAGTAMPNAVYSVKVRMPDGVAYLYAGAAPLTA
jgi:hypothetical protein